MWRRRSEVGAGRTAGRAPRAKALWGFSSSVATGLAPATMARATERKRGSWAALTPPRRRFAQASFCSAVKMPRDARRA